jgi:hypothetical protein
MPTVMASTTEPAHCRISSPETDNWPAFANLATCEPTLRFSNCRTLHERTEDAKTAEDRRSLALARHELRPASGHLDCHRSKPPRFRHRQPRLTGRPGQPRRFCLGPRLYPCSAAARSRLSRRRERASRPARSSPHPTTLCRYSRPEVLPRPPAD